eukprot:1162270-Prymnesium_polylepis.1
MSSAACSVGPAAILLGVGVVQAVARTFPVFSSPAYWALHYLATCDSSEEWFCSASDAVAIASRCVLERRRGAADGGQMWQASALVIGNGTSALAAELADALARTVPPVRVLASDVSPCLVWSMRLRQYPHRYWLCTRSGAAAPEWVVADARALWLEDASQDAVVDKGRALGHCRRRDR